MPERMRLRLVTETEEHRVTTLELFFDLVFVYALTQSTQLMADHLTPIGVGQGLAMLAVLWWCWCGYAWLGNTVHVDHGLTRFSVLAAMAVMFLVSLTIPEAFTDSPGGLYTPIMFVGCYFAVRLLHTVAYLAAARDDPALRRVLFRMLRGILPSVVLLAVAAYLHDGWQMGVWAVALVADYANVWFSGPQGWRLVSPAHFAERFGLIVIIAFGESIVAIGIGIGHLPMSWLIAATALAGLTLATALWWLYFDVVALAALRRLADATGIDRTKIATDTYTFLHLPLIAGIVLMSLGMKKALLQVASSTGHAAAAGLHGIPLWAFTGGVALYLATLSTLRKRDYGRWNVQRLVLAVLVLAATPLLALLPAAALVGVLAVAILGLVVHERVHLADARRALLEGHP